MCSKEIGLHVHNMVVILGSIVNMIGEGLYDQSVSTTMFSWVMIRNAFELVTLGGEWL